MVTVALVEVPAEAHGRRWTADDYAVRDRALARLGIGPFGRQRGTREEVGGGEDHLAHEIARTALTRRMKRRVQSGSASRDRVRPDR